MSRRPGRLTTRAAVLALVLIVGAAQLAWARAAVCPVPGPPHPACACCDERTASPDPQVSGDCCEVHQTPDAPLGPAATGVLPPPPVLGAPPAVALVPAPVAIARPAVVPAIEPRAAGPPLWLRTRSLRL